MRIAKTSKKLHQILLSRNARSIWARSRERMGYILPQDMSEIQFALFIVGESCQVRWVRLLLDSCCNSRLALPQHCGKAYGSHFFTWLVRFCDGCRWHQCVASFVKVSSDRRY